MCIHYHVVKVHDFVIVTIVSLDPRPSLTIRASLNVKYTHEWKAWERG